MENRGSSCARSSMLHGNKTWPVRQENEATLLWAEREMVRWTCEVKDGVSSKQLRLGIDDNLGTIVQQNKLRWYGHVLQKQDNNWVKKTMDIKWRVTH